MKVEEFEKQKPGAKLEEFNEWLENLEARAEKYVEEQKNSSKESALKSDSAAAELSGGVAYPEPEVFIDSIESNLESLREHISPLLNREISRDGGKTLTLIKSQLDKIEDFLYRSRLSLRDEDAVNSFLEIKLQLIEKDVSDYFNIVSKWEDLVK